MRRVWSAILFCLIVVAPAAAQDELIRVVSPQENAEVVGTKPEIRIEFSGPVDLSTLAVLIDATDVTGIGTATASGFTYRPVMALPAGAHTIIVMVAAQGGMFHQKSVTFTSRHGEVFDEAASNNEISAIYEAGLMKPERVRTVPYSKLEGNIRTDSKVKVKEFEAGVTANVRYFDQSLPSLAPLLSSGGTVSSQDQTLLRKGFSLANFLITGKYVKDPLSFTAEVGDVQITETQNTVSGLARRGGTLALAYRDLVVKTFVVKGERVVGFRGGFGIEGSSDDHIFGASAGLKLLDRKIEVKTVYVTGGEPPSSVGTATSGSTPSTPPGILTGGTHAKGDVFGVQVITDFFENRFRTEMEVDVSRFDADRSDDLEGESDIAYRAKAGGASGPYSYEARYEFYGRDFAVVGNQGAPRNQQLFNLTGGLMLEGQNLNLVLTRTNDNVRGDSALARIVKYDGILSYSYTKIPQLPVVLVYQKSLQESKREPAGEDERDIMQDTVTGAVSYLSGGFAASFTATYSLLNDRTDKNADTTTITYTLTPAYSTAGFSVMPMASWNRTKIHSENLWTDTYTGGLNLYSTFLNDRISFDAGATFTAVRNDRNTVKSNDITGTFRAGYNLKHLLKRLADPTVALRGQYTRHKDELNHGNDRDEFLLFLVLSTTIPISF